MAVTAKGGRAGAPTRITPSEQQPPATPTSDFGRKVQAHQRYYTSDGRLAPGVTTILSVLAKPALIPWANRMGLAGVDTTKYVDEAAMIGTLAHYLIECDLKSVEPDFGDFSPNQLERARHGHLAFRRWYEQHEIETVAVEQQLVSDKFGYGGTIDWVAKVDGQLTLMDLKTSSGIFAEHRYQVGGYWQLLKEHGHRIKGARILRIGRTEGEGMEEHVLTGAQVLHGWQVFEHCLAIWRLKKDDGR